MRNAFVTAQVALSVILLAVAGLFGRSLQRTLSVNPGLDPAGVVHARINLGPHGYDAPRARVLFARLADRLRSRPEVAAASYARGAPLGGTNVNTADAWLPSRPDEHAGAQWGTADVGLVELLRVPLLAGRTFTPTDTGRGYPRATVINETLARSLWPGESPAQVLGREFQSHDERLIVVGVTANGKYMMPQEREQGFAWVPFGQNFSLAPDLFVRARGTPAAALRAAREELARLDANVALERPVPLVDDIDKWSTGQRVGALLIGLFGAAGLVLAMTGLYGVLAFAVAQRLREFGVRMALGASARDVAGLVVKDGVRLVATGIALGLAGAFGAGRLIASFLFGASPADPLTLTLVPLLLIAVALAATFVPARRAVTADPMVSLRAE